MNGNPLGRQIVYPQAYDPGLLFPIARQENRSALGIEDNQLPFRGYDHWRAYELSWLTPEGKPCAAMADILVPCDSPCLIESKSMKLYFNSLNQHTFVSLTSAEQQMQQDLSAAAGSGVEVLLQEVSAEPGPAAAQMQNPHSFTLLDTLPVETSIYHPDAALLKLDSGHDNSTWVEERLLSHLFRSNCPMTAQPDWGSICIHYHGPAVRHADLLRYIVSYRHHEGFHEQCVEQVFMDILSRCTPQSLTVSIHFLRRGGLEINPLRSTEVDMPMVALPRLLRQ